MTIRFTTTEGAYKIAEVVDIECDPVTEVDITVKNGVMRIKERKKDDEKAKGEKVNG